MRNFLSILIAVAALAVSGIASADDCKLSVGSCNSINDNSVNNTATGGAGGAGGAGGSASVWGSGNSHSNSDADARSYSDADARSYSDADAKVYNSGNSKNTNVNGAGAKSDQSLTLNQTYEAQDRDPVSSAYGHASHRYECIVGIGAGVQGTGLGVSVSGGYESEICNLGFVAKFLDKNDARFTKVVGAMYDMAMTNAGYDPAVPTDEKTGSAASTAPAKRLTATEGRTLRNGTPFTSAQDR